MSTPQSTLYSDTHVIVEKAQLDDLLAAYNATTQFVHIIKCGKCGTMHSDCFICPKCGSDPEDVGSAAPDLGIRTIPVYDRPEWHGSESNRDAMKRILGTVPTF